jgi:adenylate cyclase
VSNSVPENWINTKEILIKTGISRATLNNYIRLGIIPRPLVQKPRGEAGGAKKIGYFPYEVLDRIQLVRILKREGNAMEEIAKNLKDTPVADDETDVKSDESGRLDKDFRITSSDDWGAGETPRLTLSDMRMPCYLLDYRFSIKWMNQHAEQEIFGQTINLTGDRGSRSIFKFLFGWEFHNRVRNWRDMVAFHLAFVKMKYTREWMGNLYPGVSKRELRILQEIYDQVPGFPRQSIKDMVINLLMENGNTKSFKTYTIFFKEGILFIYGPWRLF